TFGGQFFIAPKLAEAPGKIKNGERNPKPAIAKWPQQINACQINAKRNDHHIAHVARPYGADEYAIELKGQHRGKWYQYSKGKVVMRIGPHFAVGGEKVDKNTAKNKCH